MDFLYLDGCWLHLPFPFWFLKVADLRLQASLAGAEDWASVSHTGGVNAFLDFLSIRPWEGRLSESCQKTVRVSPSALLISLC